MLWAVFAVVPASAQSEVATGTISGQVTDPSGAVIPGTTIKAFAPSTGFERSVETDSEGRYRLLYLPPSTYEVEFFHSDFAINTHRPIDVTLGQTVRIDSVLVPPETQLEIIVVGQAPVVESARTQQADTVGEFRIDNLPINRRDFLDFSLLAPGVTESEAHVAFSLPITPDTGLSVSGQNPRSNSVTVDGLDYNDNSTGSARSTVTQDAVREFQINRSNFSAELGGAAGGVINIVTKSGTNDTHGTVFGFLRDQALDARNPFAFGPNGTDVDPPFRRWQAGFNVGGPIERNRTFYFVSYEGLSQRESSFSTFLENRAIFDPTSDQQELIGVLATSSVPEMRALSLALGGALTTTPSTFPATIALLESESGVFRFRNSANTALARIDHQAGDREQLFVRAGFSDIDRIGGAFDGLEGPSRGTDFAIQDVSVAAGHTHFFSPNLASDLRFQYADRDFIARSPDPFGPEITISGTALLGRDLYLPLSRTERRLQVVENVTWVAGDHEVKMGADYNRIAASGFLEMFFGGRFLFGEGVPLSTLVDASSSGPLSSDVVNELESIGRGDLTSVLFGPITGLQAYNNGFPLLYLQGFGEARADQVNHTLAGYVQDRYTPGQGLTLSLGVRYDLELQPEPVHRDTNNIGPRFGFAYAPWDRTVIRGGYGIHYSRVFQAISYIERVLSGDHDQLAVPLQTTGLGIPANARDVWVALNGQGVIGTRPIAATDLAPLGLVPGETAGVRFRTAPDLVTPYSQQASLGIERGLGSDWSASVDYVMNRGVKLLRSRNWNLVPGACTVGCPGGVPADPAVLQDNVVESSGRSIYHGGTVTVRKRLAGFYQLHAAYTFSKAIDDTTDFISELQAANQLDLRNERALSSFDQRHRLVLSGTFVSPFQAGVGAGRVLADVSVSPIVTLGSGRPFNLLLGYDANRDTNPNTDRPFGTGRNTGRGPGYASVDLRVAKGFRVGDGVRIDALVEAFNIFNRVNYFGVNNVVGRELLSTFDVEGDPSKSPTEFTGFTSAHPARQIQFGLRLDF